MNQIIWAIVEKEDSRVLRRTDENGVSWVPEAQGNRHYEEYLEWLAEGNEPEVIDKEMI